MTDVGLARRLAEAAGRILLELRASGVLEGKALGAAGDATAHQFLVHALAHARPDDGVLSEEGARDPARLAKRRVWIVDPLDGTREYSEQRPDWAVHVALSVDGVAVVGAVAQPDVGVTFCTDAPALGPCPGDRLRLVVSRTRPPEQAQRAAAALDAELVPMGSAGAKTMAVVRGEVHGYVHSGGQYEWDSAAPVAVAAAAGLHVSRLDGSALVYNREDPYLPDLLVCRPELKDRLLTAVR